MALGSDQPIMIKKVKKVVGGGHHGGAWKVAYADFVTGMTAILPATVPIHDTSPEHRRRFRRFRHRDLRLLPADVADQPDTP